MENKELQQILKDHHGLKFKLLNPFCNKKTILNKTLADRGVDNLDVFNNPKPNRDFVPSDPFRHPLGIYLGKWFNRQIKSIQKASDKHVYILVDNDADGFTSSAYLYKYLEFAFNIQAQFIFTPGKNHGIKSYSIKNKIAILRDIGLLVIPDAGLSLNDIYFLKDRSIPYLIIDHHDINYSKYDRKHRLHIFNNQWKDSKIDKEFTGVGMVYQFTRILDHLNNLKYSDIFLYLLSIGQVGDVSDISDLEIRYFVLRGFKQMIRNPLCKLTTDIDNLSAHELSFSIIPKINAVCRTGSLDDKRDLLNALVDNEPDDLITISYRRKSYVDHKFHKHYKDVDHYYLEAKQLNRIKSRQKRAVKKSLKALKNVYETKSFIIALDKTGSFKQEEAGLIATQLSSQYQKPTIVLRTCGDLGYYKGSARGNTKVMQNFKRFCDQTKRFVYNLGHPNAFGVEISDAKLKELLNEYKNINLTDQNISYNVDNIYLDTVPSNCDIVLFDQNRYLFGGKVKEPQLGFVGLKVKPYNIKFYGLVFTMKAHGLKFIQFNCPKEFRNQIENRQNDLYFDIVGSPDINKFMKFHYPQIIINNIKITSTIQSTVGNAEEFDNFYF